jgi:hypothetical protein
MIAEPRPVTVVIARHTDRPLMKGSDEAVPAALLAAATLPLTV